MTQHETCICPHCTGQDDDTRKRYYAEIQLAIEAQKPYTVELPEHLKLYKQITGLKRLPDTHGAWRDEYVLRGLPTAKAEMEKLVTIYTPDPILDDPVLPPPPEWTLSKTIAPAVIAAAAGIISQNAVLMILAAIFLLTSISSTVGRYYTRKHQ